MNKPFPSEAERESDRRRGGPAGPGDHGARLRLRCLGTLRLEDSAGNDITPRTRKARAVLAYLALVGRPASRAKLADLLWSDRGGEQARASVRQALFELRRLGEGTELFDSFGRDEVALGADRLATDLSQIRIAAQAGDWDRLQDLLSASDPGLLADLDGLDPEFDAWLQVERADEPARTLAMALAAAERCLAQAGPRAAQGIVAEVQRLDPSCEEAARLALRIDHELGDSGALHRHFDLFRDRLREDYAAEPSAETLALFGRLTGTSAPSERERPSDGDSSGARAEDSASAAQESAAPSLTSRRWRIAAVALALLALLGAAWWQLRPPAGRADEPVLIAVLPFDHQSSGDDFLAEGLWDDTRTALSRNPGLRVLGRETTRVMAGASEAPSAYRRRLGVAFLLDGRVRRHGDRVRVTVSLIRTADGTSVWDAAFDGRLGDPLALQEAMARGIEGRLRGRLARGGGTRPEHIATSADVYTLYTEARALLRERDSTQAKRAERLLRKAVGLDPNFAPAWSSLGAALYFGDRRPLRAEARSAESLGYVRRALTLAPRLAQAHATLALVSANADAQSERALEQAVHLDPSYAEAWMWLGNLRASQYRWRAAALAYRRAVEVDPLWFPAVHNLAGILSESGDQAAAAKLLQEITRAGADRELIVTTRAEILLARGDYSRAVRELLALAGERPGAPRGYVLMGICEGLMRLGYEHEAARYWDYPQWYAGVLKGERLPPQSQAGTPVTAEQFWHTQFFPNFASRAMVNLGAGRELVAKYRAGFRDADEFISVFGEDEAMGLLTPNLAVALKGSGHGAEAEYLLAASARRLERLRRGQADNRELLWTLGVTRAAQGRREEALRHITRAVQLGWLPDPRFHALDLRNEPGLASLRQDRRFEALRGRILAHVARERSELGPLRL